MDASTVGDLFERDRRSEEAALEDSSGRVYDYHWLCTSAWKAGNFLRHSGVHRGVTVGVVGDGPLALLAFFGTALLEGTTRFDPPRTLESAHGGRDETNHETDHDHDDVRALVAPVDVLENESYTLPRGAQRVGYGGKPTDPAVHHLDAGLWSENPSFPPLEIDPETAVLADGEGRYTHGAVVRAARSIVDEWGIDDETRVWTTTQLADSRAVTAGVIAPLLAGGTIVRRSPDSAVSDVNADVVVDSRDSIAVFDGGQIDLSSVDLSSVDHSID